MNLLEDPTPILVLGVLAEAILAAVLVHTRRGVLLWPMAGVLALVAAGVVVERLVVTEKERVEATIYDAARAIEKNDHEGALSFLAPSASELRGRASYWMGRLEFSGVHLSGLEITVNEFTSPATARAKFHATVRCRDLHGESPYPAYPSNFTVRLVLEEDGWKVEGVQDDSLNPLERDVR